MTYNQPIGGNQMPRFGMPGTLFRLHSQEGADGLDVTIIGVPLDIGTSNRSGSRFSPREVRGQSVLVRPYGMATDAALFDGFRVADIGDVAINTFNLAQSIEIIESYYRTVANTGAITISIGGDHTVTLPILRALGDSYGKMA